MHKALLIQSNEKLATTIDYQLRLPPREKGGGWLLNSNNSLAIIHVHVCGREGVPVHSLNFVFAVADKGKLINKNSKLLDSMTSRDSVTQTLIDFVRVTMALLPSFLPRQ